MKQILIIVLSLMSIQAVGQSNLDSTTTWTYSFWNFGIIEPNSLYINGDSIINGINWFKLDGDGSCAFSNSDSIPLIREINNRWMVYDINREVESTLYDFNLIAGDSYTIEIFGPNYPIDVIIDSTSTRMINGIDRIVQHINVVDFGFEIIEGIGSTSYLFPQGNICDPHTGPIRCFQNSIDFVDFDLDRECDESYFPTNTEETINEVEVSIYPNPTTTNNQVFINTNYDIERIEVISQIGEVIQMHTRNSNIELEEPGLFYLSIWIGEKNVIKKVVITNE